MVPAPRMRSPDKLCPCRLVHKRQGSGLDFGPHRAGSRGPQDGHFSVVSGQVLIDGPGRHAGTFIDSPLVPRLHAEFGQLHALGALDFAGRSRTGHENRHNPVGVGPRLRYRSQGRPVVISGSTLGLGTESRWD